MKKISNRVLHWKRNKNLLSTEDYNLNNNKAKIISQKGFKEISNRYTDIEPNNIYNFLQNLLVCAYHPLTNTANNKNYFCTTQMA